MLREKFLIGFAFLLFMAVLGWGQSIDHLYTVENKKMKEQLIQIYESQGEKGLRDFLKKDINSVADGLVAILSTEGVNERSEDWLKIALTIAEEKKDERFLALVYWQMGRYYLSVDNYEKMVEYFEKGIPTVLKILPDTAEAAMFEKFFITFKLMLTGDVNGDIDTIIADLEKMLSVYEPKKDSNFLEIMGNYLAILLNIKGDSLGGFKIFDRLFTFFEKTGNLNVHGNIYKYKGFFYGEMGEVALSLDFLEKALSFFKKAEDIEEVSELYIVKARIYKSLREYLKAHEMCDNALHYWEKVGNKSKMAEVCLIKADIYENDSKNIESVKMFNQAIMLYEKDKNLKGMSEVYRDMGWDLYMRDDNVNALKMIEKALSFAEQSGNYCSRDFLYETIGMIYDNNGDNDKVLEMFEKALQVQNKCISNKRDMSFLLIRKAWDLAILGKKNEAYIVYEEAIEKLENCRQLGAISWVKKFFMDDVYDQYAKAVMFMLEQNYSDKGFKYVESMKARVFLDQMAEGLLKVDKGLLPELKEKRDNLIFSLSSISKQMAESVGTNEKELEEINQQYVNVENEYKDLIVQMRSKNPQYASIQYPVAVSVKDLQGEFLKEGELVIQYFIYWEKVYAFLVSKDDFRAVELNITAKDTEDMVKEYLRPFNPQCVNGVDITNKKNNVISEGYRRPSIPMITRWLKEHGKIIYQSLFKPLETEFKGKTKIIIVPDGNLAFIPFESFVVDDSNPKKPVYLLEKYQLKYFQSATVLSMIRKYYHRDSQTKSFIGFGDPVYDYENFQKGNPERGTPEPQKGNEIKEILRGKYDREGGLYDRLPGSGEEVKDIADLFNKFGQKTVVRLREEATEENAKSPDMKEFDYIHFSSHAVLGDKFQCIVLSQIPQAKENGYLTLNEIMNCEYNAKLVVLSACQTGTGKMEKGEGITGLTSAVMYAGTPAVVASLWSVDEIGTKELMVKFYQNLLEKGMSNEEALRMAKLEMIRGAKYSSPYFWSAFVMYGE